MFKVHGSLPWKFKPQQAEIKVARSEGLRMCLHPCWLNLWILTCVSLRLLQAKQHLLFILLRTCLINLLLAWQPTMCNPLKVVLCDHIFPFTFPVDFTVLLPLPLPTCGQSLFQNFKLRPSFVSRSFLFYATFFYFSWIVFQQNSMFLLRWAETSRRRRGLHS